MSRVQQLYRLTDDAFLWLRRNVSAYREQYRDPDADFGRILEGEFGQDGYREPVNATLEWPQDLRDPAGYDRNPKRRHLSDVQSLLFYGALEGMTPRLAADPQLLAYVSHFHLHGYGISRWPAGGKKPDDHVRLHWLTSGAETKQIWNASIAGRMWWIAHTAVRAADCSGGAFTAEQALEVFSRMPEYYHRTMEYAVLRNPVLMAECVRALMCEARGINRNGYREMGMDLNREAGARLLDSLDRTDLRGLVLRSAGRLMRDPRFVTGRRNLVGAKTFRVLSLGAGAQSTVLALMAEEGWQGIEKPDLAVFADTQWEPPEVYRHLAWLEKQLSYEVVHVTAGNIRENILRGVNSDGDRFLDVPVFLRNAGGGSSVAARQCTTHYKITPIHREIRRRLRIPRGRRLPKNLQVEMWLGISADESTRIKPSKDEWIDRRFPLVEMDLTRADIYNWFGERYPDRRLPRSACVGCPYHDDMEWKWLRDNEPASFAEAVRVDWALRNVPEAKGSLRGEAFLHRSRQPLGEVDLADTQDYDEYMAGECEGLCGV